MATILVNDTRRPAPDACQTWGDLLCVLDQDLSTDGRMVTGARFDGVDEPAFRDPHAASRALGDLATVEVAVGTPTDLIRRSLDESADAVSCLADATLRVGAAFRGYDIHPANHGLSQLASGLQMLVAIATAVAQARGVGLDDLTVNGTAAGALVAEMTGHVDAVIAAQATSDWITVADIVEYDLEPTVRRWQTLFESLRESPR